jgi:hypothetical protein
MRGRMLRAEIDRVVRDLGVRGARAGRFGIGLDRMGYKWELFPGTTSLPDQSNKI